MAAVAPVTAAREVPREEWITPLEQRKQLRLSIAREVAEYASPSILTNWYTALKALDDARPEGTLHVLPARIPPLPGDMYQTLIGKCALEDETTVAETHTLMLVPEELETVNALEARVKAYGEKHIGVGKANPLQFRYFGDEVRANTATPHSAPIGSSSLKSHCSEVLVRTLQTKWL